MTTRHTIRIGLLLAATSLSSCSVGWQDARDKQLERYLHTHLDALGTGFVKPMSLDEFATHLQTTRIVYLGDHHKDMGLHRKMLELIEWICDLGHRPVLGFEAVGIQDNPSLQEYLAGGIDLRTLRRRIASRWPSSWLEKDDVDRTFFRAVLAQARAHNLDGFALEPTPRRPLAERDAVMATNVRRAMRLYPDRLIIVIVGHAHLLGDGHLTGRVGGVHLTIAARFSPALEQAYLQHPPETREGFFRTDTGVLFFPRDLSGRISD